MSNLEKILDKFTNGLKCVVLRKAKYQWKKFDEKFEPDISILCGIRHRKKLCYTDTPRFVAEVLSDSTEIIDRNYKIEVYSKVGIQEYWLIDWKISGGKVERYMLDDSGEKYILHDIITGDPQNNYEADLNILSFHFWTFKLSDLMKHIGEDEII